MMWAAGTLAAMSSLAYPAISAMVSCNAEPDQQGMSHFFSSELFSLKLIIRQKQIGDHEIACVQTIFMEKTVYKKKSDVM